MAGRFSSPDYDAESARMQNLVGTRLAELRRSRGMTQGQLAAALAPFGVRVQTAAVSKWEKDDSPRGIINTINDTIFAYKWYVVAIIGLIIVLIISIRMNKEGSRFNGKKISKRT